MTPRYMSTKIEMKIVQEKEEIKIGQLSHNWYKKQGCHVPVSYQFRTSLVPVPFC